MRPYELVVLLHPDLEIDVDTPLAKLEKLVDAVDGKVTRRDNWGKKRLAYRIKHQDFAVYVYFELLLSPMKVQDFERTLLLAEEVMRHLLVNKESVKEPEESSKKPKVASAIASKTDDKEEGSDGKEL